MTLEVPHPTQEELDDKENRELLEWEESLGFDDAEVKQKDNFFTRLKRSLRDIHIEMGNRRVVKKYGLQKEYKEYKGREQHS